MDPVNDPSPQQSPADVADTAANASNPPPAATRNQQTDEPSPEQEQRDRDINRDGTEGDPRGTRVLPPELFPRKGYLVLYTPIGFGDSRPAVVTSCSANMCNVHVFADANDQPTNAMVKDVPKGVDGLQGTWCWPDEN